MKRRSFLSATGSVAASLATPALVLAQATPPENTLPEAAPIYIGSIGLRARDADTLAAWYKRHLGLHEIDRNGNTIRLGLPGAVLLTITDDETLRIAPDRDAGLYHTAFLLPNRADLGRWILHAVNNDFAIDGAADHVVSEAIYLTDPEGNGVEIYADRPQSQWTWIDGKVQMGSRRFDAQAVVDAIRDGSPIWMGAPAETIIGHVHLKVGDATKAANWWQDQLGFEQVRQRDRAVFLSTGRYHHHVAVNEWISSGAGLRSDLNTGLDFIELRSQGQLAPAEYVDDWGTRIKLS